MKTLLLLVFVAIGVAGILYFRVNLGMNWDEMSQALREVVIPRMVMLLMVVGALAFTITRITKRD